MFQVPGKASITVLTGEPVSTIVDDLLYYNGQVSFSPNYTLDCNALAFEDSEEAEVRTLFRLLTSVSSPYISMPMACGRGLEIFSDNYFLALPKFSYTLNQFIAEKKAIEKNRFTEQFLQVVRGAVYAILSLKEKGLKCHLLERNDVLISVYENTAIPKIWRIQKGNAQGASSEWVSLGNLIKAVANDEMVVTEEITDLCDKLILKGLEGLNILKQSALLTPRQKFENILALNLYILVHYKRDKFASEMAQYPEKVPAITSLLVLLQRTDIMWYLQIPSWITNVPDHRKRSDPSGKEFVNWLRYILEHEHLYDPTLQQVYQKPREIQKYGGKPDLEALVRVGMAKLFLLAQIVARDLGLEY